MNTDGIHDALESIDERIVVARAADGDMAAFETLVRRYAPMMRAYTRRILPGSAEVDDVLQDAFITAWRHLPELKDLSKVKSWLMRITSRVAASRIRASRLHANVEDINPCAPAQYSPSRLSEAKASIEALKAVLRELPDAQRQCWILAELGEFSYEEIARELELPISTVRGLLARARKHLIIRMEQWR